jgi:hypothetical protein
MTAGLVVLYGMYDKVEPYGNLNRKLISCNDT